MKAGSTAMTHRPRDRVPSGSMIDLPDPRRPDRVNPPKNCWWSFFFFFFFDSTGMIYINWVPTRQSVNKEYHVEVLRVFRRWFSRKRPALFKSGQWHFHQDNAPVHNSNLVTDYLTKMSIKAVPQLAKSPDLTPCDFWLFPKLTGCPEVVGTAQQVHCSRRRLLRRGLEFCVYYQ